MGNAVAAPEVAAVVCQASTEKAAVVQAAAVKPTVGTKRRVLSILALLTARGSGEVGPVGTVVAQQVVFQCDRASRGESHPEGLEVAETTKPQASRGEIELEGLEVRPEPNWMR